MYYFAYGSNLLKSDMLGRCPAAVPFGPAVLPDHRLVFRHWADVEPAAGFQTEGGLWRITPECVAALDLYEDVAEGLYRRAWLTVKAGTLEPVEALVYRMASGGHAPPAPDYLELILRGYDDFGLDRVPLMALVDGSRTLVGLPPTDP